MIVRFGSVTVAPARRAAFAAVAAALFASAGIQPAAAADAASGASAPAAVVGHYTVRVGQSLNDVAAELAQTRDPATLGRVSRALFDANPDAFMKHGAVKHDPSRLKIGAVLDVPAIPGIPAGTSEPAAEASAGAAAGVRTNAAANAPANAPTNAPTNTRTNAPVTSGGASAAAVGASVPTVPAAATSAAMSASAPALADAGGSSAAASSASVASSGAQVASPAAASAGAPANAAVTAAASGASVPAASSGPAAAAPVASASDAHVWSGAIQAAPASASSATAVANAASAAHPQAPVSSIQELLALKNRVLMALQKHGIGKPAQTGGNPPAAAAPSQGSAAGTATPAAAGATSRVNAGLDWSPIAIGVAAAVGVAVFALVVGLATRRRKSGPPPSDEGDAGPTPAPSDGDDAAGPVRAADARPEARRGPVAGPATPAAAVSASSDVEPQPDETLDRATDAAGFAAATSLGADALPPTLFESPHGAPLSDDRAANEPDTPAPRPYGETFARGVEPGEPETLADAAGAASVESASALGASALPPESIGTARADAAEDELARRAEPTLPAKAEPRADWPAPPEPAASEFPEPPQPDEPADAGEHAPQARESARSNVPEAPQASQASQAPAPAHEAEPPVATEFPTDAVAALDTLDMPLPPRVGEPVSAAPLSSEPVASPEATARQAVPPHDPSAPPVGGAIEAGTAGAGSIAGLGVARFGALSLDFDLNLPPDSAEPLPVFTPEQLARIARNKLDLANEYIALGDLAGARALIHEVIESNDHATRTDAQALLATLAPLS